MTDTLKANHSAHPTDWHPLLLWGQLIQRPAQLAVSILKRVVDDDLIKVAGVDSLNLLAFLHCLNKIFLLSVQNKRNDYKSWLITLIYATYKDKKTPWNINGFTLA